MTFWEIKEEGSVLILSYNNPPMNYLIGPAMEEFRNLIPRLQEPTVRAVILQGKPDGFFITHFSVEDLIALGESEYLKDHDYEFFQSSKDYWFLLQALDKPVIAAMTGSTMGGGFETALGCDIRIAERGDYLIGLPEARLGILPGGAGLTRLTRLLGGANAIDIILRGQVFAPDDALARGLVHEVADNARARALELAQEMANLPAVTARAIKTAIYQGAEQSMEDALILESKGFYDCMVSDEPMKAMRAYTDLPLQDRAAFLKNK